MTLDRTDAAIAGRIQVQQIDPAGMSPGQFGHAVRCAVEQEHARVVTIDSLTGYLNSMPEERPLLNQLLEMLSSLGHHGIATPLVATQRGLIGTSIVAPVDFHGILTGVRDYTGP
jgi:circadian clock protein KaiC